MLKSAQSLPIPKVKSVFPDEPYSIRLGWEGVPGATHYEIWRQTSSNPVQLIATLSNVNFTYLDINRISGQSYYYAIRALDSNGNYSPMSQPYEAVASWRRKGSRDIIEKVFISKALLELVLRIV
jgi:fibronectin type 3 domain-containing protein